VYGVKPVCLTASAVEKSERTANLAKVADPRKSDGTGMMKMYSTNECMGSDVAQHKTQNKSKGSTYTRSWVCHGYSNRCGVFKNDLSQR